MNELTFEIGRNTTVLHGAYIAENGHWMLYNYETDRYTDSGVSAVGQRGEPGNVTIGGNYTAYTHYPINSYVIYNNVLYKAKQDIPSANPIFQANQWQTIVLANELYNTYKLSLSNKGEINEIVERIASPFTFKGKCAHGSLPTSGNTVNDIWYVTDWKYLVAWTGTAWVQAGIDESNFSEVFDIVAPQYSSAATYEVSDYVINASRIYRCKTAITVPEAWTPAHWEQTNVSESIGHSTDDDVNYILGV